MSIQREESQKCFILIFATMVSTSVTFVAFLGYHNVNPMRISDTLFTRRLKNLGVHMKKVHSPTVPSMLHKTRVGKNCCNKQTPPLILTYKMTA